MPRLELLLLALAPATAEPNGLARTPQMGWNPYNCLSSPTATKAGCWPPTEEVLRATAAALKKSGLQDLGYEYINLDGGWSVPARDNKTGRVQWNPAYYPSGIPAITKDFAAAGFKFGIYSDSGTLHCGGGAPGGLGHEVIDAQTFADWGVQYLKYDNCFAADCKLPNCGNDAPSTIARYTAMSEALNKTGKPILFSMCEWGDGDPAMWGPAVSNSWRTTADISDVWVYMCELADLTAQWFDRAGPGGWNDPDLLEVGNKGMTTAEYRSQFSLWALMKAPLLISTSLANMTAETLAILSAKEIIAINQDSLGVAGRLVEERPPDPSLYQVWAGPLSGGRVACVMWNRGNVTMSFFGRFVDMQLYGKVAVRDAWAGKDMGVASGQITATVDSHDVKVFVLTPVNSTTEVPLLQERLARGASQAEETRRDAAWAAQWKGHGIRVPQSRLKWEASEQYKQPRPEASRASRML